MQTKILLVEDDSFLRDGLCEMLGKEGYTVVSVSTVADACRSLDDSVNLIILDVMLPDTDGFTVLRKIREDGYKFPVIMLTAKVEDNDKIIGLSLGADDYITKPFNPLEMVSRVKAQLRRYTFYNGSQSQTENKEIFDSAGLIVNHETHECTLYEKPVQLTPTEFNILWLLCKNAGKVVSTEEIFEKIWNEKYLDSNNTVMVHIRRIREKLNEPSRNPKFIKTVWGVGYKIEKK